MPKELCILPSSLIFREPHLESQMDSLAMPLSKIVMGLKKGENLIILPKFSTYYSQQNFLENHLSPEVENMLIFDERSK